MALYEKERVLFDQDNVQVDKNHGKNTRITRRIASALTVCARFGSMRVYRLKNTIDRKQIWTKWRSDYKKEAYCVTNKKKDMETLNKR